MSMAAFFPPQRRPLTNRTLFNSPIKQNRVLSGSKRPRSPEPAEAPTQPTTKRVRPTGDAPKPVVPKQAAPKAVAPTRNLEKEKRQTEREQKEAEFRDKYKRAFPTWKFYFDPDGLSGHNVHRMKSRVEHLNGVCSLSIVSTYSKLTIDAANRRFFLG